MESMPLGERIRAARLERKMTQDELARDTFSKSYVSAVELGKIHPSIKALRILARRLQLPASYFLETLEPDLETQQAQLNLSRARLLVMLGGRDQESLDLLKGLDQERLNELEMAEATFLEGRVMSVLEQPDEALTKLEQARTLWDDLENQTWVEHCRNLVGEIFYRQHKYIQAQEQHKASLEAIRKGQVRDPNLKLAIYSNLAKVYTALDMHDAARGLFEEANGAANEAATPEVLVGTLWEIARQYQAERDLGSARQSILQGQGALETAETTRMVTNLYLVYGSSYLAGHNWAEAERCFQTALTSATPHLPGATRIAAYDSLANLFLRQDRLDEAENAANQAHQTLQEEGSTATLSSTFTTDSSYSNADLAAGRVLLTLGRIMEKKGNSTQADRYFEEAIQRFKQGKQPELLSDAYFSYGEVLLERGDAVRGANFLRIAYEEKSRQT